MMVTDIVDTIVWYEVHTQVFEWRTYEDKSSIYFRKWYGFTHYEFLILLSIFLFIINVYPVARFRKIP